MFCVSVAAAAEKAGEPEFATSAPHAIVIDATTGETFFEKNADDLFEPASMSKLMTMCWCSTRCVDGTLKEDETITISEDAWRRGGAPSGGSTMYAEVKSQVPVKDLMKGVIIQSANDAAIAFAERLGGTEAAFAEKMTARAKEIGLKNSMFRNATGCRTPSICRRRAISPRSPGTSWRVYPQYYPIYGERVSPGTRHPAQPQPAAGLGRGRRRDEDRLHLEGGLWPHRSATRNGPPSRGVSVRVLDTPQKPRPGSAESSGAGDQEVPYLRSAHAWRKPSGRASGRRARGRAAGSPTADDGESHECGEDQRAV